MYAATLEGSMANLLDSLTAREVIPLAWSDEYGDWMTDQWWFWALIFVGSVVFAVLGQVVIHRVHKRWPPRG